MASCYAKRPSSMFPIAIALALSCSILLEPCKATRIPPQEPKDSRFIQTSCNITTYPALCVSSLSSYANKIQTNPMEMAQSALSVALNTAQSTSAMMKTISTGGGMSARVAAAMSDCMETIRDSVDELKQSMKAMGHLGGKDFDFQLNSIETWVSAAITNDDTCMEGFAGHALDGKIKSTVRSHVVHVSQLTSNALALINNLAATHSTP